MRCFLCTQLLQFLIHYACVGDHVTIQILTTKSTYRSLSAQRLPEHTVLSPALCISHLYRVIHKSLRDFRPCGTVVGMVMPKGSNRGRDAPSFCSTLQVLDMSTLGDAADVNPVIKFMPHTCNVCGENMITVPQRSEIPEEFMNYPAFTCTLETKRRGAICSIPVT